MFWLWFPFCAFYPEEAMLKTKGTKKNSKVRRSRLGMSGPVKGQRSPPKSGSSRYDSPKFNGWTDEEVKRSRSRSLASVVRTPVKRQRSDDKICYLNGL